MKSSIYDALRGILGDVVTKVAETLQIETLKDPDPDATSAENQSSSILLLRVDGQSLLFTGDAGAQALQHSIDFAKSRGISLSDLNFFQVPHHGSRHNIGPTILNQIGTRCAFVSASTDGAPKHPSKRVTNALKRRKAKTYATQGVDLRHYLGIARKGWVTATEVPFYTEVEAD
jgi:beta-lactamase superfamily II metal-dependent hydrolase